MAHRSLVGFFLAISLSFIMATPILATVASESAREHQSIDAILPMLLEKYNVTTIQALPCDSLSEDDLERLGDAWMETIHPGQAHEGMDRMMGGEGSENLRAAHIQMGRNYLGCDRSSWGGMGAGMMGGGFMSMMNNSRWAWHSNRFIPSWYPTPWFLTTLLFLTIAAVSLFLLHRRMRGGEEHNMKLDKIVLANALGLTGAILWVICLLLITLFPGLVGLGTRMWFHAIGMSAAPAGNLTITDAIFGGITFIAASWLIGFLFAWIWEALSKRA
ncbi:MAG: DUF5676 family membrane protein [bacterium]|nr:DUF5676 family membrane protein [bacterium]